MRPKNKEFQSYVQKKLKSQKDGDVVVSLYQQTEVGISYETHMKLGKLFEDLLQLENQLEMHRKYKLSQINIRDAFRCIDRHGKGYATLDDYYQFFENFYSEDLPLAAEEIDYLFHRHDKETGAAAPAGPGYAGVSAGGPKKRGMGRVTEAMFLKELMPLEDYIVVE